MIKQAHMFPFPSLVALFLFLSLSAVTASKFQNQLERGGSLSVERDSDVITSPDNTFTCGFHGIGTNAYLFAIWFTNSRDMTVVWTANRDNPVNGKGSKLSLRQNGAIVLTDVDGAKVWEANDNSTDVAYAELLNTGNFVLRNSQGEIIWQSFDYPTDTLLPSQSLTMRKRLISRTRNGSYASGYYSLYFDSDNILKIIYNGPEVSSIYWPNRERSPAVNGRSQSNTSRNAFLDDMGRIFSSDRLQVNASDMGFGIKRRLTMDDDGNLRIYSLTNPGGLWMVSWQAIAQPCNVHGVCGRNGICSYTREGSGHKCSCPPGYEVRDPTDWIQGCKPMYNPTLVNSRQVKFLKITNSDYWGFDLNSSLSISFGACRDLCLKDVDCQAFSYRINGEGRCYSKSSLFNGYQSPSFAGNMYLKLPNSLRVSDSIILNGPNNLCQPTVVDVLVGPPSMYNLASNRVRWTYIYSFCLAIGGMELLIFTLGWWFLFSKHGIPSRIEEGYRMISSQFRKFTYAELKKATKNFREELGKGGSGAVYKGVLVDQRVVAVKRLGDVFKAEEEFWVEMSTIGKINHMNLVRMWGFCSEGKHRLLVYEYAENLSLDKHLFASSFLRWKQRYAVALGTAKGLAYLHHECLEWVIHCDVKPENILLDREFQPKIADFGLAKLCERDANGSGFTMVRGTKGYIAPEWALNHPITAKVDVYSFGVLLLEIVKGIRLSHLVVDDPNNQETELTKFLRMSKEKILLEEESWIEEIVDPRLKGDFCRKQAKILIEVGLSCVSEDRNKRPAMDSVVQTILEHMDETTIQS